MSITQQDLAAMEELSNLSMSDPEYSSKMQSAIKRSYEIVSETGEHSDFAPCDVEELSE